MSDTARLGRLIPMVRRGSRPVCLVVPGAGGGFQPYLQLAIQLGERFNVLAARAAGLVPPEEPEDSLAVTADVITDELRRRDTQPALVVGWSVGGVIGWEVCVRLAERACRPDLVIVDASPLPRVASAQTDAEILDQVMAMLGPRPDPATAQRVRQVFCGQLVAMAAHEVVRGYPGRVLLLLCAGDGLDIDRAAALEGWQRLAPRLQVASLDAGHFEVFEPARLGQLVDHIEAFVDLTADLTADLAAAEDQARDAREEVAR